MAFDIKIGSGKAVTMTARYRISDYQKSLLRQIDGIDRAAIDYFVTAPLLIDCRDDRANFDAALTPSQRDFLMWQFNHQNIRFVSALARPARDYAMGKLRERYLSLDKEGLLRVRHFLQEWITEQDRGVMQKAKPEGNLSAGIDVILPYGGVRLSYDHANVIAL